MRVLIEVLGEIIEEVRRCALNRPTALVFSVDRGVLSKAFEEGSAEAVYGSLSDLYGHSYSVAGIQSQLMLVSIIITF